MSTLVPSRVRLGGLYAIERAYMFAGPLIFAAALAELYVVARVAVDGGVIRVLWRAERAGTASRLA